MISCIDAQNFTDLELKRMLLGLARIYLMPSLSLYHCHFLYLSDYSYDMHIDLDIENVNDKTGFLRDDSTISTLQVVLRAQTTQRG